MAFQVPYGEPTKFTAGDSLFWDVAYPSFPASDGWQLTYEIRGQEDLSVAWTTHVTADGDGFSIRIPASSTELAAGAYTLTGRVALSGEVHTVYAARLLVVASPVVAVNAKSFNRQMLDAIEEALLTTAGSAGKVGVSVNGRSITYGSQQEAEVKRAHYAVLVALEENPDGRLEHAVEFSRG